MRITFLFFLVLIFILYFYFQSPSNDTYSVNTKGGLQQLESTSRDVQFYQSLQKPNNTNNQMKSEVEEHPNSAEANQLQDTKSDFSIQPIDPESDPGNQIISEKY